MLFAMLHVLAAGADLALAQPPCAHPCGNATCGDVRAQLAAMSLAAPCAPLAALGCACDGCCDGGDASGADAPLERQCEHETVSHPLIPLFFDPACVESLSSTGLACPIDSLHDFMEAYGSASDVLVTLLNIVALFFIFGLTQLSTVPTPSSTGHFAPTMAYWLWVGATAVQWVCALLAIVAVVLTFVAMDGVYRECMLPWRPSWPRGPRLLNVLALATFAVQPAFMSKVALAVLYPLSIYTGLTANSLFGPEWTQALSLWSVAFFEAVILYALGGAAVAVSVFAAACWALSGSFVFSVLFVPIALLPTALALGLGVLVHRVWRGLRRTEAKWAQALFEQVDSAFRWLARRDLKNRFLQLFVCVVSLQLASPLVIYGVWTASVLYGSLSSAHELRALVATLYSLALHDFATLDLSSLYFTNICFPLDWELSLSAFAGLWEILTEAHVDLSRFLDTVSGLASLSVVVGLAKPISLALLSLLTACSTGRYLEYRALGEVSGEIRWIAEREAELTSGRDVRWLRGKSMGNGGLAALCEVLRLNAQLEDLDLSANDVGDEGAEKLAESVLSHTRRLRSLAIAENDIEDDGAEALAKALRSLPSLEFLDLSANAIGPQGAAALASALPLLRELAALDLSDNPLGASGGHALALSLAKLGGGPGGGGLARLSLGFCALASSGVLALAGALQTAPLRGLEQLELGSNGMGDKGAAALAEALPELLRLRALDLADNALSGTASGCVALLRSLHALKSLTRLSLGKNELMPEGAAELARSLHRHSQLRSLNLGHNRLCQAGRPGFDALAAMLPQLEALQELGLGKNELGPQGAALLASALPRLRGLRKLTCGSNALGDDGVRCLADALEDGLAAVARSRSRALLAGQRCRGAAPALLETESRLEVLTLANNAMGDAGLRALARVLPSLPALRRLAVGRNEAATEEGEQELRAAWQLAYGQDAARELVMPGWEDELVESVQLALAVDGHEDHDHWDQAADGLQTWGASSSALAGVGPRGWTLTAGRGRRLPSAPGHGRRASRRALSSGVPGRRSLSPHGHGKSHARDLWL